MSYNQPSRYDLEKREGWDTIARTVPSLNFKSEWDIKIIPPFAGAVARFRVLYKGKDLSVYLDSNDSLGCVGEPYWELYPYNGDTLRFLMNDTEELMAAIEEEINRGKDPLLEISGIIASCEMECNYISDNNGHCMDDDINHEITNAYNDIKRILEGVK